MQAKCEQVAGIPLLPDVEEHLLEFFLAKGASATTAIEGNTLSEEEALKLIKGELVLPPSRKFLGQEIKNIVNACHKIADGVLSGDLGNTSVQGIKELNGLVLHDLPLNEGVVPDVIRRHDVGVGRYRGAPHQDCEYLLRELCRWLDSKNFLPDESRRIAFGILKAIIAHLYVAWIHPFGDGNGRTARLVEFQLMLSCGVPSVAAHLLSNHYNITRDEYYRQLDLSGRSGGGIFPFIKYALQGFIKGLNEQILTIERHQLEALWMSYVHDTFRNKVSVTDIRRRQLVVDLTQTLEPVPIVHLRYISPRIAEAYAGKTDRTIRSDVNALEIMGLIRRSDEGVEINRERIMAFLSPVLARGQTGSSP
ncbi:MAG: Fic family protein [Caldilineaceae bacterium]|nr:Fic family protein [Caldilineaceae bacterium]